jgi:hypothetical protein
MQGFFGGVDSVSGSCARRQAHLAIADSLQGAAFGRKRQLGSLKIVFYAVKRAEREFCRGSLLDQSRSSDTRRCNFFLRS